MAAVADGDPVDEAENLPDGVMMAESVELEVDDGIEDADVEIVEDAQEEILDEPVSDAVADAVGDADGDTVAVCNPVAVVELVLLAVVDAVPEVDTVTVGEIVAVFVDADDLVCVEDTVDDDDSVEYKDALRVDTPLPLLLGELVDDLVSGVVAESDDDTDGEPVTEAEFVSEAAIVPLPVTVIAVDIVLVTKGEGVDELEVDIFGETVFEFVGDLVTGDVALGIDKAEAVTVETCVDELVLETHAVLDVTCVPVNTGDAVPDRGADNDTVDATELVAVIEDMEDAVFDTEAEILKVGELDAVSIDDGVTDTQDDKVVEDEAVANVDFVDERVTRDE